jgi:molybdate transport system regulatory protein
MLSDWRADLLETIERTGSLARAAEEMEVPYRTAWYKLKEIEEQLDLRLLETQSGGLGGGGSTLTVEARHLVERFRRVRAGVADLVRERFQAEFGDWPR